MNKIVITVPEEADGTRADKFLAEAIDHLTRSALQKLISVGNVEIDGKAIAKSRILKEGEDISVLIPDAVSLDVEAEDIPLNIYYEDDDLLVVYKPKGMVVHPAPGNHNGTLVNALLWHCRESLFGINGVFRIVILINRACDRRNKGHLILCGRCIVSAFASLTVIIVFSIRIIRNGWLFILVWQSLASVICRYNSNDNSSYA